MNRLNEEQLEDALSGLGPGDDLHEADRRKLAEHEAIRARLGKLRSTMNPPSDLSSRVRNSLQTSAAEKSRTLRLPRLASLAAAACLVALLGGWMIWGHGAPAFAQDELAGIHRENLHGRTVLLRSEAPAEIARRIRRNTGNQLQLPQHLSGDCRYAGSSLAVFRDRTVGCVMIRDGLAEVSIICIQDRPESLGFYRSIEKAGRTWHFCGYQECKMVAVRAGDYTLVAVGELPKDRLRELLEPFVQAVSRQ